MLITSANKHHKHNVRLDTSSFKTSEQEKYINFNGKETSVKNRMHKLSHKSYIKDAYVCHFIYFCAYICNWLCLYVYIYAFL